MLLGVGLCNVTGQLMATATLCLACGRNHDPMLGICPSKVAPRSSQPVVDVGRLVSDMGYDERGLSKAGGPCGCSDAVLWRAHQAQQKARTQRLRERRKQPSVDKIE